MFRCQTPNSKRENIKHMELQQREWDRVAVTQSFMRLPQSPHSRILKRFELRVTLSKANHLRSAVCDFYKQET